MLAKIVLDSSQALKNVLGQNELVVVNPYPKWCGSALAIQQHLEKLIETLNKVSFKYVEVCVENVVEFERYANKCEPTFLVYVKEKLKKVINGCDYFTLRKFLLSSVDEVLKEKEKATKSLSRVQLRETINRRAVVEMDETKGEQEEISSGKSKTFRKKKRAGTLWGVLRSAFTPSNVRSLSKTTHKSIHSKNTRKKHWKSSSTGDVTNNKNLDLGLDSEQTK